MKITTKQVTIPRTLDCEKIENLLAIHGEPLRWAIVKATATDFLIDAVFIK